MYGHQIHGANPSQHDDEKSPVDSMSRVHQRRILFRIRTNLKASAEELVRIRVNDIRFYTQRRSSNR